MWCPAASNQIKEEIKAVGSYVGRPVKECEIVAGNETVSVSVELQNGSKLSADAPVKELLDPSGRFREEFEFGLFGIKQGPNRREETDHG